ncbi:hypothetical protein DGMP_25580 [Desulfomarina profundi]|uniref:FAD dependent oxidoreductase domain-containing protein n=1 Tax=Desulfomarina profundi TaxID=2772557 RepID=A0A8D5JQ09_9BACT|nr:FAD-dependent oxidoreductase [Desulfomarina profundi]BCL61865.1 hypothetical protein DGMP_25580 [Desulfomarina profundi]
MTNIIRYPEKAASRNYDVIIIGGGIYGITLALEASLRGKRSLLLEKGDFGEYTSFNSLKIIHGGLRYLQSLDLPRFWESVRERSWYLKHFPHRVHPMPCLMPLYGRGLKRPVIFRIALLLNHLLSPGRNRDLEEDRKLPVGRIVSAAESQKIFPLVNTEGLQGSALWYDACMPDSQLLVMELLRTACDLGATPLNYCEVQSLTLSTDRTIIEGVHALDRESGKTYEFSAPIVINSAGPWCRAVVNGIGGDCEELFRPSLAWNISFNRPALSDHALAVQADTPGSRALFVTPWKGRIFAGCGHEPWLKGPDRPMPTRKQINTFIKELNAAIPGLDLNINDVHRVFAGLLPTVENGSNILTRREVIIDHGAKQGPQGLYSVGGIKFTTARLVAEKIWGMISKNNPGLIPPDTAMPVCRTGIYPQDSDTKQGMYKILASDKTIVHLDDLIVRRSTTWEKGPDAVSDDLTEMFDWGDPRKMEELAKCIASVQPLTQEDNS